MKEINIPYEEHYNIWTKHIQEGLDERNIVFTDTMLINICESIQKDVSKYLLKNNYPNAKKQSDRLILVEKLKEHNKKLIIVSNRNLWLYLEYFTDIKNYTNCFDIYLEEIK